MKDKIILITWPYVFREFDYFRFEIRSLEREFKSKVIIHELVDIIFPNFKKAYFTSRCSNKVYRFHSFFTWRKEFRYLVNKYPKILIISDIYSTNLFSFLINVEIKNSKRNVLQYAASKGQPGNWDLHYSKINFYNLFNINKIINFANNNLFNFLANWLKLYPSHCLLAGSKNFKINYNNKVKLIKANTFDYSNYITYRKYKIQRKEKFAIYLDSPTPLFDGDNLMDNSHKESYLTISKWYPRLNMFFDNIEKLLNIKIKISAHPKIDSFKTKNILKKIFYNREILSKRPIYYLDNAKCIISKDSSGFSFAVIKRIPSIIITSNELIKNYRFISSQNILAKELGTNLLNIDDNFCSKKFLQAFKVNTKKYLEYKFKHQTSLRNFKSNYKIIGENFL